MYKRQIAERIRELIQQFPMVAVTGPRQSGKTTLLKSTFPEFQYVSLEDPDIRAFAQSDPRHFLETYPGTAILDEVQYVPELFSYLQTHTDKTNAPGQYILSGSQNFLLLEQISQSLAGRVALLNLLPLSIDELTAAKRLPKSVEEYLFTGSYPRIYQNRLDPSDWLRSYIQTYLERDVRKIKNVTDLSTFQRFLQMCASRCGQLLNLSSLANDCGITHNTAKSWISVLEASFIVFLQQPYFANIGKRLVKTPKLHFYDTGLACALAGIEDFKQLTTHYLRGGLFESMIISELMKKRFNDGKVPKLYFWRDKTGHEVDCLIETSEGLIPIEIKSSKTVVSEFFSGIIYWKSVSKSDEVSPYVIYGGNEKQIREQGNVLPWNQLKSLNW